MRKNETTTPNIEFIIAPLSKEKILLHPTTIPTKALPIVRRKAVRAASLNFHVMSKVFYFIFLPVCLHTLG
jgi:hypothetical protein